MKKKLNYSNFHILLLQKISIFLNKCRVMAQGSLASTTHPLGLASPVNVVNTSFQPTAGVFSCRAVLGLGSLTQFTP